MKLFGQTQLLEDVQLKGLCVGCGACVSLCPYFSNYRGKTSMLFHCDRETGRCFAYCPKAEVDYDEVYQNTVGQAYSGTPLGPYKEIVKAKAAGKVSGEFQCGGTASALMACALENGMIKSAVVTDSKNGMPAPGIAETVEDILACSGSKYFAAPVISKVNKAAKEKKQGLGVVAMPCQSTAIALMKANPTDKPDFNDPVDLVVGLFCTWALDARKLEELIEGKVDGEVKSMDIPPPPAEVLVVETDRGKTEIPLDLVRPIVPQGYTICPDMTSELADVSVGVVEGEPEYNTLIIRTDKGAELVKKAVEQGYLETVEAESQKVEHLTQAAANKKKRALEEAEALGVLNTPENSGRAALRISQDAIREIQS